MAVGLLAAPDSTEDDALVVRISHQGGAMGATYSKYEFFESGRLLLTQSQAGGQSRQVRAIKSDESTKQRYWDILEDGGFLTGSPDVFHSELVQSRLGIWQDVPSWKLEIFRDGEAFVSTIVPPEITGRLYPELQEVPYVRSTWTLVSEFRSQWDRAAEVNQ